MTTLQAPADLARCPSPASAPHTQCRNLASSLTAQALVFPPCPQVEEPTVRMTFAINTSPFAGREGKYVTSRNIKERLDRELERNLAMRVEPGETADQFIVSGRGALHISILMENMRREGYEFAVGPPKVRFLRFGSSPSGRGSDQTGPPQARLPGA